MILDNHSEYDRNKTRGVPRPGKALLHGLVYCGECGHKMVVQYKKGTRYICNYLRQQYQVPVCQYLPADPIDAYVVGVFFDALALAELDLYARAWRPCSRRTSTCGGARQQQIERLRYQARLAERQFNQADPDNRLVTAELERHAGRRPYGNSSRPRRRSSREQQQPPAPEALDPEEPRCLPPGRPADPGTARQGLAVAAAAKSCALPGGQGRRPPLSRRILCRSALSGRAGTRQRRPCQ